MSRITLTSTVDTPPEPPLPEGMVIVEGAVAELVDETNPDSITIVTQPNEGRVIPRQDGRMTYDRTGIVNDSFTERTVNFSYDRNNGGDITRVNATVTIVPNTDHQGGSVEPKYYRPKIDNNDAVVWSPHPNTREIRVRAGTYATTQVMDETEILRRHAGSGDRLDGGITNRGLAEELARDVNGDRVVPDTLYGETDEYALDINLGPQTIQYYLSRPYSNPWALLYKRGESFVGNPLNSFSAVGKGFSALRPSYIGPYGSGALPYFETSSPSRSSISIAGGMENLLIQDLNTKNMSAGMSAGVNFCYDNVILVGAQIDCQPPASEYFINFCWRRMKIIDSSPDVPTDQTNPAYPDSWFFNNAPNNNERAQGGRIANFMNGLLEKVYITGGGWCFTNWSPNGTAIGGVRKPADALSHAIYGDTIGFNQTFRDLVLMNNSHGSPQTRCGGLMDRMIIGGGNTGLAPIANGGTDPLENGGRGSTGVNLSLVNKYVQSEGGFHDWDGYNQVSGGGIIYSAQNVSIIDSIITNDGLEDRPFWITPADVLDGHYRDPDRGGLASNVHFSIAPEPNPRTGVMGKLAIDELIVSNWYSRLSNRNDVNVGGTSAALRDSLRYGAWLDQKLSTTGKTFRDFDNYLRGLDSPWEVIDEVYNYFMLPYGKQIQSRAATTVRFSPTRQHAAAGRNGTVDLSWHTRDLPGTIAGDSVDLDGHIVYWNQTPENSIASVLFGVGGELHMFGGALEPTVSFNPDAGGNKLWLESGAQIKMPEHFHTNPLDIRLIESRMWTEATVHGNLDVAVHGRGEFGIMEGGSYTVQGGNKLLLSGRSLPIMDGAANGTATLTVDTAGTLEFRRACRLRCANFQTYTRQTTDPADSNMVTMRGMPRIGEYIEGETSGATGIISRISQDGFEFDIFVDEITGEFLDTENILAKTWSHGHYIGDSRIGLGGVGGNDSDLKVLCTVSGTPTYTLATVQEFPILDGRTPSVNSAVVLNTSSIITADTAGLSGPYVLMDVDSITDNGASLPPNTTIVDGVMTMTV